MARDDLLAALKKAQDVSYVAPGAGVHGWLIVGSYARLVGFIAAGSN